MCIYIYMCIYIVCVYLCIYIHMYMFYICVYIYISPWYPLSAPVSQICFTAIKVLVHACDRRRRARRKAPPGFWGAVWRWGECLGRDAEIFFWPQVVVNICEYMWIFQKLSRTAISSNQVVLWFTGFVDNPELVQMFTWNLHRQSWFDALYLCWNLSGYCSRKSLIHWSPVWPQRPVFCWSDLDG